MRALILRLAQLVPARARPWLARRPVVARAATRALGGSGREVVRVRGGSLGGVLLELEPAREKAFWAGTHELGVQRILLTEVRRDMVCWDIGAHIGFFALLLALHAKSVVAVEAHPGNAQRLRRNVELNDLPIEVVESAVWRTPGTLDLQVAPMSGMHSLVKENGVDSVQVTAVTLDELAQRFQPPDLVKIDVEGAEIAVLEGGRAALRHATIVLCETHGASERAGAREILEQLSFSVTAAGDDYLLARRPGA